MPEQNQTYYDFALQLRADRERYSREGVIPFTGYIRPKPTAAEEAEANRLNAARALPDELFDDDHEVQRLREALRVRELLIEKRFSVRSWLAAQIARQDEAIKDAEYAIPLVILEDAQAQDDEFPRTRKAVAALELAKAVRAHSDAAYAIVAPSDPAAQKKLYDERDAARTALAERIFALKKAHVDAQTRADQEQSEGGV